MTERQADRLKVFLLITTILLAGILANLFASMSKARADIFASYGESMSRKANASTACLPSDLRSALAKVNAACGIKVISTYRPNARIAGTRHVSLHASCRAADFTTRNPGCVLSALSGWRGKLSTDYARVRHFHIDNGSYARFAHGGGKRRYAKRSKTWREARVR